VHPFIRILIGVAVLPCSLLLPGKGAAQHFPPDDDLRLMLRFIVEDAGTPGVIVGVLEADGTSRVVSYGSAGPSAATLGAFPIPDRLDHQGVHRRSPCRHGCAG